MQLNASNDYKFTEEVLISVFEKSGNDYIFDETGGKIIPAQQFNYQNNLLISKGKIEIDLDGKTNFELIETAKGVFFDQYAAIENYIRKGEIKGITSKIFKSFATRIY